MSHPCCTSVALPFPLSAGAARQPVASFVDGNPLADDWLLDLEVPGDVIITWSGTLASTLFGDDPRTWMRAGHDAFRAYCDSAAPTLVAQERRIAFRAHARHVLSDVQGCLNFLRMREGQPFDLAFAPADLLTPDMLPNAEDHLTRAFEALGSRAKVVLLHDALPSDGDDGELPILPVPLGRGVLPGDVLRRLVAEFVPASTPILLLPEGPAAQIEWLRQPVAPVVPPKG